VLRVTERNGRVRFSVHIQPRASTNEIAGVHGDALKIRIATPPIDGAANDALTKFLSDLFAVARRDVRIIAGETSRSKIVEVDGITERAVRQLADRKR